MITNDSVPQPSPLRPRTAPLFPPVLCQNAVEVLSTHFTITLQSLKHASVSPTITNDSVPQRSPLRPRTPPLFPPVLGDDAVEVLGPCRPAKHTLWVIVTGLITQHGAFARGIRAGGMPGVVTPRHHMAFQGGLEGRGGVLLLQLAVEVSIIESGFATALRPRLLPQRPCH